MDIWALGCTLYAMAFGTCPFESPVEGIMKLAILDANVSFPKNNTYHCCSFSNPFCKFIRMMLRLDIEARITIDDCIEKTQLLIEHCPKQEVYCCVCCSLSFSIGKGVLDAVQQGHESPWIVKPAIHWAEKKEPFTHVFVAILQCYDG